MKDNTLFNLGNRIKKLSEERGMSINQLAKKSTVPVSTIRNILNGTSKNPGIETIVKLCKALEVSLAEFFEE